METSLTFSLNTIKMSNTLNEQISMQLQSDVLQPQIQEVINNAFNKAHFGAKLKALRLALDTSLIMYHRRTPEQVGITTFAKFLGIENYSLQRLERGKGCSLDTLQTIIEKMKSFIK